jgi:hypothetical protein
VNPYAGTMYRSRSTEPESVFRLPFVILLACLFAIFGALMAYLLAIPILPITGGGAMIGLGVGAVCWLIDRHYS